MPLLAMALIGLHVSVGFAQSGGSGAGTGFPVDPLTVPAARPQVPPPTTKAAKKGRTVAPKAAKTSRARTRASANHGRAEAENPSLNFVTPAPTINNAVDPNFGNGFVNNGVGNGVLLAPSPGFNSGFANYGYGYNTFNYGLSGYNSGFGSYYNGSSVGFGLMAAGLGSGVPAANSAPATATGGYAGTSNRLFTGFDGDRVGELAPTPGFGYAPRIDQVHGGYRMDGFGVAVRKGELVQGGNYVPGFGVIGSPGLPTFGNFAGGNAVQGGTYVPGFGVTGGVSNSSFGAVAPGFGNPLSGTSVHGGSYTPGFGVTGGVGHPAGK